MIADDGRFELMHVQPGSYEVELEPRSAMLSAREWGFVSSVWAGGKDVTDTTFEVGKPTTIELSVKVDFHPAAVSGKALDPSGKPISSMNVVLISADPGKRLKERYFLRTITQPDGSFGCTGIPGDYLMLLWPGEDVGQVLDPGIFAKIEKAATRVRLARGSTPSQDLRLTPEIQAIAKTFAQ
jgi:hypothetical protein